MPAQDTGHWWIGARAMHLDSANQDETGFGLGLKDKRWGLSLQAGVDLPIGGGWMRMPT